MSFRRDRPDPRDRIILSDFLLTRWVWLIIIAASVLGISVALRVVLPLFSGVTPAESHEVAARETCRAEVAATLEATADQLRFADEVAEEFGENTWNVNGAVELGWSDRREYACTYTGEEIVDVRVGAGG